MIEHNSNKFEFWDLAGKESYQSAWKNFYSNTDAIIYLIDTT